MRLAIALALALSTPSIALARTKAGVTLPDEVEVASTKLLLNGLGLREATVLKVSVYVAGLYLPHKSADGAAILAEDAPKRLVMHFVRDVDKDDIDEAFEEGLEKVLGEAGAKAMASRFAELKKATADMKSGHELSLTYVPERGTELAIDGKVRGTVAGKDFARALFGIYLGKSPPNEGLKVGLLGG